MKKTLLAIAITGLFATTAQAANVYDADGVSADVYGRMQFDIESAYDDSTDSTELDGTGSARMGFNGKSVISDGFSAVAKGEWQIASENNHDSKFTARHLYAGFESADYGTAVFGQTDTAFYQAVAATDIFNTYGYEAFAGIEDGRQEGQVVYNGNFSGFYVGASYQFRNKAFAFQVGNPNNPDYVDAGMLDNAYALTLGYEFDFGLAAYAGYHTESFENMDKDNYALSLAYTLNDLYLAGALVGSDVDGDMLTGYDIVASYAIDKTSLYTGYAAQEAEGVWEDQFGTSPAAAFKLGAAYKFNSNMKSWIEYKNDSTDGAKDKGSENSVTVAVQYNF